MPEDTPGIDDPKELASIWQQIVGPNEKLLRAAAGILAEGPIQEPVDGQTLGDAEFFHLSRLLSWEAELAGRQGDRQTCAYAVLESLKFSKALSNAHGSLVSYMVWLLADAFAVDAALESARKGWLTERSMREIVKVIPEIGATAPALAEAMVLAFQWSMRSVPKIVNAAENGEVTGSFDAIAEVRLWARFYGAARLNALRDWRHQDSVPDEIARDAGRGLPVDPDPTSRWEEVMNQRGARIKLPSNRAGTPSFWAKWLYRIHMNVIPNSFGRALVAKEHGLLEKRKEAAIEATRREGTKTVIALRLYVLHHNGRLPLTLQPLVSEGYLDAMPMDPFSCAPLGYDRSRRMVYSDGPGTNAKPKRGSPPTRRFFEFTVDQPKEQPRKHNRANDPSAMS